MAAPPTKGLNLSSITSTLTQKPGLAPGTASHPVSRDSGGLASRWRELAGSENWEGLLDPMDPLLRAELIRYGEFAQACYDAFDFDSSSRYYGGCKYDRGAFFESLGMADRGYEVTRYLYATSNIKLPNFSLTPKKKDAYSDATNWIGYVAVSTDAAKARLGRRDIVVAWRGTVTKLEWVSDVTDIQRAVSAEGIPCPDPLVKALAGFLDLYTDKNSDGHVSKYSVREQVLAEIRRLLTLYGEQRGEEISISVTGHSLGSALATINAYDLAELRLNRVSRPGEKEKVIPVTVYSFAGPRVGNDRFQKRFQNAPGLKSIRVMNKHDMVPRVPGVLLNEGIPILPLIAGPIFPWDYYHVGVTLELDNYKSPFLKKKLDYLCFHNLEASLHLLDGYHGTGREFALANGRDLALVNKDSDFLNDELNVRPRWKREADRGLVRNADGSGKQPERAKFEDHPADIDHLLQQTGIPRNGRAK